jgi:MFS family permease
VLGPLLGAWLLTVLPPPNASAPFRTIFLISVIPGLIAVAAMAFLVEERRVPGHRRKLWRSFRDMPRPYLRFLTGVGLFGAGDFAHTLLVLAAAQLLTPEWGVVRAGEIAALFYVLRNGLYAAVSFPVGALGDRMNKQALLAAGYVVGGITGLAAAGLFYWRVTSLGVLAVVFALGGIYIGMEDALEGAIPAELVTSEARGTAYGLMGTVNGVGDLIASALVGTLWTAVSPVAAFVSAAALMLAGAGLTWRNAR